MYCKHCGALQDDSAVVCTNCNAPIKDGEQTRPNEAGQQASTSSYQQPQQGYNPAPSYNQPQQGENLPPTGFDPPPQQGYSPTPPPGIRITNWLVPNIIVTVISLCCCQFATVTGIIGIVFSAMVSGKEQQGDIAGATKNASIAKIMFIVSIALSVIGLIAIIVMSVTGVLAGIIEGLYEPYYYW